MSRPKRSTAGRLREHHREGIGLSTAVGLALTLGIATAVCSFIAIDKVTENNPSQIEIVRAAFAAVAGVGGAVALVVAYRRQQDLEQGRFVERFGAAASQLGDADPAVRIAGVYAMAAVADECTTFSRRQQCINTLCGYLRLPYDPQHGSNHLTVRTRRTGPQLQNIEETYRYRQNDFEVRSTVLMVITRRLRDNANISWSHHDFNFGRAVFENANFSDTRFWGRTSFDDATFEGNLTTFEDATFDADYISFRDAVFSGHRTTFKGAVFRAERISFRDAMFCAKYTSFGDVNLSATHISFDDAKFTGEFTRFVDARFSGVSVSFDNAVFDGESIRFDQAVFNGSSTTFNGARLTGKAVWFVGVVFNAEYTSFDHAIFEGDKNASPGRIVSFEGRGIWRDVHFDWDSNPAEIPACVRPRNLA